MGVLDRVNTRHRRSRGEESRYSIDTWISDYLIPSGGQFQYGGQTYPFGTGLPGTLAGNRAAEIANSLPGYRQALQASPPAFAAQMVRAPGPVAGEVYLQEPAVAPGDAAADVREPGSGRARAAVGERDDG